MTTRGFRWSTRSNLVHITALQLLRKEHGISTTLDIMPVRKFIEYNMADHSNWTVHFIMKTDFSQEIEAVLVDALQYKQDNTKRLMRYLEVSR